MNTKALLFLLFTSTLTACGLSDAEKQQAEQQALLKQQQIEQQALQEQQAHDDSIRLAAEQRMQTKYDLEQLIMNTTSEIETMKEQLLHGNAEMEVAIDRLARIKELQLMRTSAEREEQIRAQSMTIQNLEDAINSHKSSISEMENSLAELRGELERYS